MTDLEALIANDQHRQMETSETILRTYKENLVEFYARHDPQNMSICDRMVDSLSWECINQYCFRTYGDTPGDPSIGSIAPPIAFNDLKQVITLQRTIPGPPLDMPWGKNAVDERVLIDEWIAAKQLNKYGDPLNSAYSFSITDRYSYIRQRHPSCPWRPTQIVRISGTGNVTDGLFGTLVWSDQVGYEQLFVSSKYEVVLDDSGKALEFSGANIDYWSLEEERGVGLWVYMCGGWSCCCCLVGLLCLLIFLLGYVFHSHPTTCFNGIHDPSHETSIDCGGICLVGCKRGWSCKTNTDCLADLACNSEGVCADPPQDVEAPPGCVLDAKKTERTTETGTDCGGACAAPHQQGQNTALHRRRCPVGQGCQINDDCASLTCSNNKCS